jgi:hypothetical protein
MKPSGVKMNPEPLPARCAGRSGCCGGRIITSMLTTAGPIAPTAPITARE